MNEADPKRPVEQPNSGADERPRTATPGPATQGERSVDIQAYIGARLRSSYNDVASQPVPDRFLQLMQQLDKA